MASTDAPPRFGFVPLGIGDVFSRKHFATSLLLFIGDRQVMIDCPAPLPRILYEASLHCKQRISLDTIDDVILTHLHGDHSSGLECLGFHARFNQNDRARIWTLAPIAADLWEHRLKAAMGYDMNGSFRVRQRYDLSDFFDVRTLDIEQSTKIGGAEVHVRLTRHAPTCFGVKVFFEGRSFGYSSDTAYDPKHIEFLEECDTIVHETGSGIHTHYNTLANLPKETRDKIYLVHISDRFDASASVMPVLEQGKFYTV